MILLLCLVAILSLELFLVWKSQMPEPTFHPVENYNSDDARFIYECIEQVENEEHLQTCRNMIETLRRNHSNNSEALWDYEGLMVVWKLKREQLADYPEVDKLIASAING